MKEHEEGMMRKGTMSGRRGYRELWEERTYQIAKMLEEKGKWKQYLREKEYGYLKENLVDREKWTKFMTFTQEDLDEERIQQELRGEGEEICQNKVDGDSCENGENECGVQKGGQGSKAFEKLIVAFHARSVIFEQYVTGLYPIECKECKKNFTTQELRKIMGSNGVKSKNGVIEDIEEGERIEEMEMDIDIDTKNELGESAPAKMKRERGSAGAINEEEEGGGEERGEGDKEKNGVIEGGVGGLLENSVGFGKNAFASRVKKEEDDYDYDDDEDDEDDEEEEKGEGEGNEGEKEKEKEMEEKGAGQETESQINGEIKLKETKTEEKKIEKKETFAEQWAQKIADEKLPVMQKEEEEDEKEEILEVEMGEVFETLEHDIEAIGEVEKWRETKEALQMFIKVREEEIERDKVAIQVGAMTNVKHLAQFIDSNRKEVELSTAELTTLLGEVRPKKTKWANDEYPKQDELYTGLESVLGELRGMGVVSLPFLTQVKRRDAPDYYDVIQRPMDLGTMGKKLKNLEYRSKREFMDDIQLIRNNCFEYNTTPNHPYRKQAEMVMKRAEQLLAKIPEVEMTGGRMQGTFDDDRVNDYDSDHYTPSEGRTNGVTTRNSMADDTSIADDQNDGTNSIYRQDIERDEMMAIETPLMAETAAEGNTLEGCEGNGGVDRTCGNEQEVGGENKNGINGLDTREIFIKSVESLLGRHNRHLHVDSEFRNKRTIRFRAQMAQRARARIGTRLEEQTAVIRTPEAMQRGMAERHYQTYKLQVESGKEGGSVTDYYNVQAVLEEAVQLKDYTAQSGMKDVEFGVAESKKRHELYELVEKHKEQLEKMEQIDKYEVQNPHISTSTLYDPGSGIPERIFDGQQLKSRLPVEPVNDSNGNRLTIESYQATRFPDNEMWKHMAKGIDVLRDIREVDNQINIIKFNHSVGYYENSDGPNSLYTMPSTFLTRRKKRKQKAVSTRDGVGVGVGAEAEVSYQNNAFEDNEEDNEPEGLVDFDHKWKAQADPLQPLVMDRECGIRLVRRTCAVLLANAGFERLTTQALDLLTEVTRDYLCNLGRTLRSYIDTHSSELTPEAMLAHCLYENGVERLSDLSFYAETIYKTDGRLIDTLERLETALEQQISGKSFGNDDASAAFGNEYSYMNGDLATLADDFFGFQELGLDAEVGVDINKAIPPQLWYGRNYSSAAANSKADDEQYQYIPPPKWPMLDSLDNMVGLFLPFLVSKFQLDPIDLVSPVSQTTNPAMPGSAEDPYFVISEYISKHKKFKLTHAGADGNGDGDGDPQPLKPLVEDDTLPPKARFGHFRPKVPPPNRLTNPKLSPQAVAAATTATTTATASTSTSATSTNTKKAGSGGNTNTNATTTTNSTKKSGSGTAGTNRGKAESNKKATGSKKKP